MSRRMADPQFRAEQLDGIRNPQVVAVNGLCDLLSHESGAIVGEERVPYIAPHYDARSASVLLLLSNPGPKAGGDAGSGMLSWENDDASAARMLQVCEQVGLSGSDAFPWNAYPWHVHEKYPNGLPKELVVAGLDALAQVLQVAPNIRAIIAHGGDARRSVRLLAKDVLRSEISSKTEASVSLRRGIRAIEHSSPPRMSANACFGPCVMCIVTPCAPWARATTCLRRERTGERGCR